MRSLRVGKVGISVTTPNRSVAYQQLEPKIVIDTNTNTNTHPQMEEVRVDMAAMKVDSRPVELLTSVGSCVAICVHDSARKCGGLAHIMLPHSSLGPQEPLPSKYADTAVPALIRAIRGLTGLSGAHSRLSAKIAGGANMFTNTSATGLDIGTKNTKAVREALEEYKVRLIGEDVGGSHGRRVSFNLASGVTVIRLHTGEIRRL